MQGNPLQHQSHLFCPTAFVPGIILVILLVFINVMISSTNPYDKVNFLNLTLQLSDLDSDPTKRVRSSRVFHAESPVLFIIERNTTQEWQQAMLEKNTAWGHICTRVLMYLWQQRHSNAILTDTWEQINLGLDGTVWNQEQWRWTASHWEDPAQTQWHRKPKENSRSPRRSAIGNHLRVFGERWQVSWPD